MFIFAEILHLTNYFSKTGSDLSIQGSIKRRVTISLKKLKKIRVDLNKLMSGIIKKLGNKSRKLKISNKDIQYRHLIKIDVTNLILKDLNKRTNKNP